MKKSNVPHQIDILATFSNGSFVYRVSDHFYESISQDDTRDLEFKSDDMPCFYLCSSVYLDQSRMRQPIYEIPQDLFDLWHKLGNINRALVLGCAGCTIPRFLILSFSECRVVGVDLSDEMIDIAHRYFFIPEFDERFLLLHDNAFSFIAKHSVNAKYDIIYTDLFDGPFVLEDVFSLDFMRDLFHHMSENALLLINLLDVNLEKAKIFARQSKSLTENVILLVYNSRIFLILVKATNERWCSFKKMIEEKYDGHFWE